MSDLYELMGKMQRALSHAKLLKYRTNRFLESRANDIAQDSTSEPGYLIVRAYSRRPPPPSLGVLMGEALYQLRSVLNHLVHHLSEQNEGRPIRGRTKIEFPVRLRDDARDKWWEERIGKLTQPQRAVVKAEQPYIRFKHAPESDPLWLLCELSDFDRHRSLHTVTVSTRESRFYVRPPVARNSYQLVSQQSGPISDAAELARFRINHQGPELRVEVESQARFDITFADGTPAAESLPVVSTIGAVAERVGLIFDALRKA